MYSDYERLLDAFRHELRLWPPSEQEYESSLAKAKMHSDNSRIKLSQTQKDRLFNIYLEERDREWAAKSAKA